jgi:hypothetical protein
MSEHPCDNLFHFSSGIVLFNFRCCGRRPSQQRNLVLWKTFSARLVEFRESCNRMHIVIRFARILQGADPNSIDDGGSPALALAVTNKCPLPLLQALLLAGADPDAAAPTGSPLQVNVSCGESMCLWQPAQSNLVLDPHLSREPRALPLPCTAFYSDIHPISHYYSPCIPRRFILLSPADGWFFA